MNIVQKFYTFIRLKKWVCIICWFLIFLLYPLNQAFSKEAPASQPSKKVGLNVTCNEWVKDDGFEGECQTETNETTWKVKFYREGKEKRTFKNLVKNLIVVFPPDGSSHKIHEWWDSLVGPGKAFDTRKWVVLCLNYPFADNSKMVQSLFHTSEAIFNVEKATIHSLYPELSDYVVGGASRGAHFALLLSQKLPKEIRGIFLVNFQAIDLSFDYGDAQVALKELDAGESIDGPYDFWNLEQKGKWWKNRMLKEIETRQYTENYFQDPKWMVDVNMSPSEYKNANQFKTEVVKTWLDYFRDNEHPRPLYQRTLVLSESAQNLKEKDYKKLPKKLLLVANKLDQNYLFSKVQKFSDLLTSVGIKVSFEVNEDVRGHTACCIPNMPLTTANAIQTWLEKL